MKNKFKNKNNHRQVVEKRFDFYFTRDVPADATLKLCKRYVEMVTTLLYLLLSTSLSMNDSQLKKKTAAVCSSSLFFFIIFFTAV